MRVATLSLAFAASITFEQETEICGVTRVASLSSPPELVSKLLDPWEQQEHASSRRIATLVNELAGEVRNGHKQVVVLGAAPGARAMGVSTPQRAPRSAPGVPPAARDGAALAADVRRRSLLTLGQLELRQAGAWSLEGAAWCR